MTRFHRLPCVLASVLGLAFVATAPPGALANPCLTTTNAFGLDAGGQPRVKTYGAAPTGDFLAFPPSFTGGVRVAVGDLNGDGVPEIIVGAGPGGGPHVRVLKQGPFDPVTGLFTFTEAASFFAFPLSFTGGVYVAAGNFDPSNDPANAAITPPDFTPCATLRRRDEIVVAAGAGGGPHVQIFKNLTTGPSSNTAINIDVANPLVSFFAFPPGFTGGVRVAAEDLNNDGFDDLVVGAGPGGGPHVQVFRNLSTGTTFGGLDLASPAASFFAFTSTFTGGVYVSTPNWDNDSRFDVAVGAGEGGGPHVRIFRNTGVGTAIAFDLATPIGNFFAFDDPTFTGGVRIGPDRLTASHARIFVMTGPGGSGFGKTVIRKSLTQQAQDFFFGVSPFDLSRLGVFPAP